MIAILLAAGQGSRLLPLTLSAPKCLVPVGGRAIIDHQLDACAAAGIERAVVVGGYRIEQVAEHLSARKGGPATELVFNPFWAAASSIGSVWAARDALRGPFALMNGDTLFDPALVAHAVADAQRGVRLVVDRLEAAEEDDMLVEVADGRVRAVSKTLSPERATHRSLGLVMSAGGGAYADALRAVIGADEGIHAFHHAVIDRLAGVDACGAIPVPAGAHWQEIDRPADIARWREEHQPS
ncbi:sugar phosphate nucleotidyltransferase [Sphingomonas rubra]|uniref:Choline kinase n=1 Tax=Sphingomonas rubra TaxID=634430 RepID=A0A1I5S8Z5_9SPHN|nr:NTP transferase domain-containing protein [Sphingomonas rubra]SFP67185.1 Choline kinase [Sphingomonas rubra]